MTDRTGQTWEEHGTIFVVVGPPIETEWYDRHPVCILLGNDRVMTEERFMEEGEISWESFPYMIRIA